MNNKKFAIFDIAVIGFFIALEIILSRFLSISMWNMKIGFSFIPVVICAKKYGWLCSGLVGGLSDLLGSILFPIGPYFPGFTITSMLIGVVFGLFFYSKCTFKRVVIAVLITQIFGSLILNTVWISLLYGSPITVLLPTRIIQTLVLCVVQVVITELFLNQINITKFFNSK